MIDPDRQRPPDPGQRARGPWILTGALVVAAVVGAVLLFTVVKPDPDATATGVVSSLLSELRSGHTAAADSLRCEADRTARPGDGWLVPALGAQPSAIANYSVRDEGEVRRVSDGRTGTAVLVTATVKGVGTKSFSLFVVREGDEQRVCGIGSLSSDSSG